MRITDGVAYPEGPVTVAEAVVIRQAGDALVASGCRVFDLAGVGQVDSSVLSVLLAWKRAAGAAGGTIEYRNLPANILSLVDLYGIGELIAS